MTTPPAPSTVLSCSSTAAPASPGSGNATLWAMRRAGAPGGGGGGSGGAAGGQQITGALAADPRVGGHVPGQVRDVVGQVGQLVHHDVRTEIHHRRAKGVQVVDVAPDRLGTQVPQPVHVRG